jgi:solute carrier family 45 protein 1/2/4
MSVTLYFAEEIPLEPKDAQGLSDSAPLLNGSRDDGRALNEQNNERFPNGHVDRNNVSANTNTEEFTEVNSDLNRDNGEVFNDVPGAVLVNILTSMRHLPPGMHSVLVVMALTWLSWFPFFLFDTDWMGREVYHGDPNGDLSERKAYDNGVREGAFGLLLNSVVLGIGSFLVDPLCRMIGARLVWAISNFTVFICMMATTILSWISSDLYSSKLHHIIGANKTVKNSALVVFSLLGLPLSITYSVPFSVTAELTAGSGGGQGLATGVLNLAIVFPQIVVSLGAGPWDALYGGGNIPAFALASIFSLAAGVLAVLKLPKLSNSYQSAGFHGFG